MVRTRYISKNQEISTFFIQNFFEAITKSFLIMYKNKKSTKILLIANIFIKSHLNDILEHFAISII